MSVRKRTWKTAKGEEKSAWVAAYTDARGKRRLKTFAKKKDADKFAATASVEVRAGVHVADSESVTVEKAGEFWIVSAETAGLERSTINQYRQHLDLHIAPMIGEMLLSKLTVPAVRAFEDQLHDEGRSPAMVRKILVSLGSLLADAQERGLVVRNAVREKSRARVRGGQERRQRARLKVGVDIPTPAEIKAIVEVLEGSWRPLLLTAIFTGMRASELRGLTWDAVDLEKRTIRVHQRADRFNAIGRPKSEAGERSIPVPPLVANTLKEWRLACPKGDLGLVFPNGAGNVESLANIINRGLLPVQVAAGVTVTDIVPGENDIVRAKYGGMHALRHFYASWCINTPADGGLGLSPKVVQERLGHATIGITLNTYSHLFPRGDDADEMAAAERSLLA